MRRAGLLAGLVFKHRENSLEITEQSGKLEVTSRQESLHVLSAHEQLGLER
jgi:hypothetical protein